MSANLFRLMMYIEKNQANSFLDKLMYIEKNQENFSPRHVSLPHNSSHWHFHSHFRQFLSWTFFALFFVY
jgi:hypothetical protein